MNEVVIPDVIGDTDESIRLAMQFRRPAANFGDLKYMAVVQGETQEDLIRCTVAYASLNYIDVLGVPRHLVQRFGKFMRYSFVKALEKQFPDAFEAVHCLGAALWVEEVTYLRETSVRSIDTSLPIVLALEGVDISKKKYMSRPDTYFQTEIHRTDERWRLANKNIDTYVGWANGK